MYLGCESEECDVAPQELTRICYISLPNEWSPDSAHEGIVSDIPFLFGTKGKPNSLAARWITMLALLLTLSVFAVNSRHSKAH